MSTPKAPTPLRSCAAGGLEKEPVPDGLEDAEDGLLEDVVDGRLDADGAELLVADGFVEEADAVLAGVVVEVLVSVGFEEADAEDGDPVLPLGRVALELDEAGPLLLFGLEDAVSLDDLPAVLGLPGFEPLAEVAPAADVESDLASTFSAVRSIVTGRLEELAEDDDAPPDLSDEPDPLPLEEEDPPEDFLSVAISSPPEPYRSQDLHYTHLFAKRYRCGKDFCALQKNDSPGSG